MHIAVLGTGIMGSAVADRLIQNGHTVAIYNRTAEKMKNIVAQGAHAFSNASQAVRASDAAILMLADINAINAVLFGLPRVSFKNRTIIQMSTISPEESLRLAKRIQRLGGNYFECPVLGSKEEAKAGTLILMFGGKRELFDQWTPFLSPMGKSLRYIGDIGSASGMKLALNQLIAGLGAAFTLSLAFVESSSIDRDLFMEIVRKSALSAPMFDKKWERLVDRRYDGPNFPTKLLLKDVNLFLKEAKRQKLNVDSLTGIRRVLELAIKTGQADVDYISIIETMRARR